MKENIIGLISDSFSGAPKVFEVIKKDYFFLLCKLGVETQTQLRIKKKNVVFMNLACADLVQSKKIPTYFSFTCGFTPYRTQYQF